MNEVAALAAGGSLLLATTSHGKQRELRALLRDLPLELVTPDQVGPLPTPEENGATFAANAAIKARAYRAASGLPVLAEDSGLEVEALGGAPGVYSARWEDLPDGAEKNARLVQRLAGVPPARRGARYVCHMMLIDRLGVEHEARGELRGQIALEARGEGGFGYDPVMYLPDVGRTVAEMAAEEKDRISHRGVAAAQLRVILFRLLQGDQTTSHFA